MCILKTVLIADTETTGVDPKTDHVIEIGAVLWSIEHRTILECYSGLIRSESNAAEVANGIPSAVLVGAHDMGGPLGRLAELLDRADATVAHNAEFDRSFAPFSGPVICSLEDMVWPRPSSSRSLTAIALAHGVAVVSAHRAIHDCLLMARLFEAVPDIAQRLEAGLEHSLLPKAEMLSLAPFEMKDVVKEHGFHWDPSRRVWHRTMAIADAAKLPFQTMKRA